MHWVLPVWHQFSVLLFCVVFLSLFREKLASASHRWHLVVGQGGHWTHNDQPKSCHIFPFKSLNSLLFLGWLILMWSLIVVVMRNCLNSARLSSDQSEINEVDYLSHAQRAIISVGSLFFVIAQFVVIKGEVEMTGRGRRSFERVGLRKLLA